MTDLELDIQDNVLVGLDELNHDIVPSSWNIESKPHRLPGDHSIRMTCGHMPFLLLWSVVVCGGCY